MFLYIVDYLKNIFINDSNLDSNLLNIKNNLKKTITLKKIFYTPTYNELNHQIFLFNLKKKMKINIDDLINIKINLKNINN